MANDTEGFMREPEILKLLPISRTTWWKWCGTGKAPRPIKISHRVTVWKRADILAFIAELADASTKKGAA